MQQNQYLEQSVTILKIKQKEIVNKIFLNKIWCIGQIYPIPKFIKNKIQKAIT